MSIPILVGRTGLSDEMITEDAFTLLKKTPPFSFPEDTALKGFAKEMLLEFHPKGHTLHRQGKAPDMAFIPAQAAWMPSRKQSNLR